MQPTPCDPSFDTFVRTIAESFHTRLSGTVFHCSSSSNTSRVTWAYASRTCCALSMLRGTILAFKRRWHHKHAFFELVHVWYDFLACDTIHHLVEVKDPQELGDDEDNERSTMCMLWQNRRPAPKRKWPRFLTSGLRAASVEERLSPAQQLGSIARGFGYRSELL